MAAGRLRLWLINFKEDADDGFEDVVLYYEHLMEHLKWKSLGHVLAGGNGDVGDIEGKPELQKAWELGKSIY